MIHTFTPAVLKGLQSLQRLIRIGSLTLSFHTSQDMDEATYVANYITNGGDKVTLYIYINMYCQ